MRLRIESATGSSGQCMIRAPGYCCLVEGRGTFELMKSVMDGSISESELEMLFSVSSGVLADHHASEWFEKGWNHAFWVHVATTHRTDDTDDVRGEIRNRVLGSYIEELPLPPRKRFKPGSGGTLRSVISPSFRKNGVVPSFTQALTRLSERRTQRCFRTEAAPFLALAKVLTEATRRIVENRLFEDGMLGQPLDLLRSYGCWLELGLFVYDVEGLAPGIYRFDIPSQQLEQLAIGFYRDTVSQLIYDQPAPRTASFTLALFVDFAQVRWRYRHQRALRNVFIELGRIGQDCILAGLEVGLASFPTPAIKETEFAALFGVDPLSLFPAYTITQGL